MAGRVKFSIDLLQGLFDDENFIVVPGDEPSVIAEVAADLVASVFGGFKPGL